MVKSLFSSSGPGCACAAAIAGQAGLLGLPPWALLVAYCLVLSLMATAAWRLHRAACRRTQQETGDEQMAAMGNLAAGIEHEIRNPLNTVSLTCRYIERMLGKAELDTALHNELNRNFEVIGSELGRLDRALDVFLLLARPANVSMAGTDLDGVVDEALTLCRRELETCRVELDRKRHGGLRVSADPDRLGQVFVSIIRNAVQAMPDGGTLSVRTSAEGGRARVTLADTGHGIAEKDLPHVFESRFTTRRSGLGLSLALSLKTVTAHGGTLDASSRPGQGATFTVVLPIEAAHA